MPIATRSAILSDLPTLLQFEQGVIEAERPMDPDLRLDHILYYDIKELIQADHIEMAVALDGDRLVGSGYARLQESKSYHTHNLHAYLGFMYTHPDYRGQGINGLITEHLKLWSQGQGAETLILEVYHDNPSAIRSYEKAGFEPRLLEMRLKI